MILRTCALVLVAIISRSHAINYNTPNKNIGAFAALRSDGRVITWGVAGYGGDSSSVTADIASGVTAVYSTQYAFAALKSDGSVITWGDSNFGADSSSVAFEVSNGIDAIYTTDRAFAAVNGSGHTVAWGDADYGGDTSLVDYNLRSTIDVSSAAAAFTARRVDMAVSWGDQTSSDTSAVMDELVSGTIQKIYSTDDAFAALKTDGTVVTWGNAANGGDSSAVAPLTNVATIFATRTAFAALHNDGTVSTWGNAAGGGDSAAVSPLTNVASIYATSAAFAALEADGDVVTWGDASYGGNSAAVAPLTNVNDIFPNEYAFAALKDDATVVTWGDATFGGDSSAVTPVANTLRVYPNQFAFCAISDTGAVTCWGSAANGGTSPGIASGATSISATTNAFAAVLSDGSVVAWGNAVNGGDTSGVSGLLTSVVSISGIEIYDARIEQTPTAAPTFKPTSVPSTMPTDRPTPLPTVKPTKASAAPTSAPLKPTRSPTAAPVTAAPSLSLDPGIEGFEWDNFTYYCRPVHYKSALNGWQRIEPRISINETVLIDSANVTITNYNAATDFLAVDGNDYVNKIVATFEDGVLLIRRHLGDSSYLDWSSVMKRVSYKMKVQYRQRCQDIIAEGYNRDFIFSVMDAYNRKSNDFIKRLELKTATVAFTTDNNAVVTNAPDYTPD